MADMLRGYVGNNFEHFFFNGVKRSPGRLRRPPGDEPVLNLGSGNAPLPGAANLDRPEWRAPKLWLPVAGKPNVMKAPIHDGTVGAIHMYHFLEHLDPSDALDMLMECQRVLMPKGCIYLVVPHAMTPLGFQAPDHRSFWTEEGLQDTFYSAGYDTTYGGPEKWDMDITWMMCAGVKWSNLCVLAQIVKRIDGVPYETPWRRDG